MNDKVSERLGSMRMLILGRRRSGAADEHVAGPIETYTNPDIGLPSIIRPIGSPGPARI